MLISYLVFAGEMKMRQNVVLLLALFCTPYVLHFTNSHFTNSHFELNDLNLACCLPMPNNSLPQVEPSTTKLNHISTYSHTQSLAFLNPFGLHSLFTGEKHFSQMFSDVFFPHQFFNALLRGSWRKTINFYTAN